MFGIILLNFTAYASDFDGESIVDKNGLHLEVLKLLSNEKCLVREVGSDHTSIKLLSDLFYFDNTKKIVTGPVCSDESTLESDSNDEFLDLSSMVSSIKSIETDDSSAFRIDEKESLVAHDTVAHDTLCSDDEYDEEIVIDEEGQRLEVLKLLPKNKYLVRVVGCKQTLIISASSMFFYNTKKQTKTRFSLAQGDVDDEGKYIF